MRADDDAIGARQRARGDSPEGRFKRAAGRSLKRVRDGARRLALRGRTPVANDSGTDRVMPALRVELEALPRPGRGVNSPNDPDSTAIGHVAFSDVANLRPEPSTRILEALTRTWSTTPSGREPFKIE